MAMIRDQNVFENLVGKHIFIVTERWIGGELLWFFIPFGAQDLFLFLSMNCASSCCLSSGS